MTTRKLHLVRHGPVNFDLNLESSKWELASEAAPGILKISGKLSGCDLRRIVASPQRKAIATARILTDALDLSMEVYDGLEEHHRLKEQQSPSEESFRSNMRRFFAHPREVVFGSESAAAALR